jgi:hypothetical protein
MIRMLLLSLYSLRASTTRTYEDGYESSLSFDSGPRTSCATGRGETGSQHLYAPQWRRKYSVEELVRC